MARSYEDARTALDLAHRLGLPTRQLRGADLLVYQVLGRDRAAITDLVATVLARCTTPAAAPSRCWTRSPPTSTAGNAAAAARTTAPERARPDLPPGPRPPAHRRTTPTAPEQRYTLETAVLGARLLDWPAQPLPPQS